MDQGSTMTPSAVHNFAPTVTKFCVMWEGQALPHDTKFGNSRCEIVGRRVIFIWSLIHGLRWSGLIKAEPGDARPSSATLPIITFWHSLAQDCSNSSALAMKLLQSCTKPSFWPCFQGLYCYQWFWIIFHKSDAKFHDGEPKISRNIAAILRVSFQLDSIWHTYILHYEHARNQFSVPLVCMQRLSDANLPSSS